MRRNGNCVPSLLLLAAPVLGQHRAPCTGIVRDPAGAALAGAQVVCSWSPDGSSLARAETHSTTTDAAGRYTCELAVGRAWCIWAIGPAGADERRRVVPPTFTAVGGRTLDLVADRVMAPVQLQVTGASAWQQAGPLALRIVVAGQASLPDFVIAGDGVVKLPPLPTPQITVCLLDFRRDVLASEALDVDGLTPCAFAKAGKAEFVVVDADDAPVAGASIVTASGFAARHRGRFDAQGNQGFALREVAVTDATGRASGLVRENTFFLARHDGAYSRLAGNHREQRIENGGPSAAETGEPFRLRLEPGGSVDVQATGGGDEVVLHGVVRSNLGFRMRNGGGSTSWFLPLTRDGDRWTAAAPGDPYVLLLGEGTGPRPLRVAGWTQRDPVDLTTLRRLDVHVVGADGHAAPFAVVGISHSLQGFPVHWTTHLATDGEGRATLRVMPGDCELYAATNDAHGYVAVTDATATAATIQLEPLALARVRIVDRDDRPVAGARVEFAGGTVPNSGIGRVAHPSFHNPFGGVTSDEQGHVVARVPKELAGWRCTARWRNAQSPHVKLELDRPEPIELRLPR